jgi:hypothetical protein
MNPDECAICFEGFTPDSGHSVLGCGHKFHMMCVVRWFQDQTGPSTCPCCRRESGQLDNVPLVEEGEDDESIGSWAVDEEEEDDEDVGELRPVWMRQATGQWERSWIVTGGEVAVWDPVGAEHEDVPEEMEEGALALQRIWRGWIVRQGWTNRRPVLLDEDAARILVTLSRGSIEDDWHYQRFVRVS